VKLKFFLLMLSLVLAACDAANEDSRVVGQLESDRIEIRSEFFEPIVEIAVAEGQSVSKGDLLLRQDDARITARIDETEAALAQSQARLDELVRGPRKEQIDAARAIVDGARRELDFRQTEYERAQIVYKRELSSEGGLDTAKAALDRAETTLDVEEARLQELRSGTTVEELAQAEQAIQQIESRLSSLQIDRDRHQPLAPVDGIVDSRLFEAGEQPAVGQPMLILLSGAQPYARIYVPESLRVHVRPGAEARVYVDGLTEPLKGSVRWISSEAAFTPYFALTEHDRGRLSFLAKVDILGARERLPDGIPVEVELILDAGGG
jgi:HlyD family secretion protein